MNKEAMKLLKKSRGGGEITRDNKEGRENNKNNEGNGRKA